MWHNYRNCLNCRLVWNLAWIEVKLHWEMKSCSWPLNTIHYLWQCCSYFFVIFDNYFSLNAHNNADYHANIQSLDYENESVAISSNFGSNEMTGELSKCHAEALCRISNNREFEPPPNTSISNIVSDEISCFIPYHHNLKAGIIIFFLSLQDWCCNKVTLAIPSFTFIMSDGSFFAEFVTFRSHSSPWMHLQYNNQDDPW